MIDHPVFTGHSPSEEVNLVSTCLQHGRRMNWVQAGPNMASNNPPPFPPCPSHVMLAGGGCQAAMVPSPATNPRPASADAATELLGSRRLSETWLNVRVTGGFVTGNGS